MEGVVMKKIKYFAQWHRHGEAHFAEAWTMERLETAMKTHHSPPTYDTAHVWQAEADVDA